MWLKRFRKPLLIFCSIMLLLPPVYADDTSYKHIEVSLRMIGHQILLNSHDSTSRILPIERENDTYKIHFGSEFAFNPEELVSTINNVVRETGIAKSYIVEVEHCETDEVVYSFEMNNIEKTDIIPCKTRNLPKACYSISFTIIYGEQIWAGWQQLDSGFSDTSAIDNEKTASAEGISGITYWTLTTMFVVIGGMFFFIWRKKSKTKINPNLIQLGEYLFDKQNTELILENKRIELSSTEADLLLVLYNTANKTVEREVILNKVWGDEGDYVGRTLDVFISKLRKKLEADSSIKIVNIRGVGYKLVAEV